MRTCPSCGRPDWRSPGSRTRSVRTCQVLRPRRVIRALAIARSDVSPSATQTASAPGISFLSWLNGWPARTPADASPTSSRTPAHGSGPMWFAIPSSQWTCTTYSLPVSRRTRVKTQKYSVFGCRFTLPELPLGQHRAIWRVNFFEHRIPHAFSHGLGRLLPDAVGRNQPRRSIGLFLLTVSFRPTGTSSMTRPEWLPRGTRGVARNGLIVATVTDSRRSTEARDDLREIRID
ncbi:hypothetical protein OKW46_001461 [Paraburkholderia sp. WSM4179]|nr:hypothetical protein [Paraburkholderia sp. WSM4179]